jgi:MFS family permease
MLMSLSSAGVCFIVFPLVSNVAGLLVVAFLVGLGLGMAGPLSQNLLYDASPPDRVGEVMGLRVTVMNSTATVVPLASGALSAAVGVLPIFWVLAASLVGVSYWRRSQWKQPPPGVECSGVEFAGISAKNPPGSDVESADTGSERERRP